MKKFGDLLVRIIETIPFPNLLGRLLRFLTSQLANFHPLAPLLIAMLFSYFTAAFTLWLARQPLWYFSEFFGWISGHNAARLSVYNTLAHILAFVYALKIVFEMRPLQDWSPLTIAVEKIGRAITSLIRGSHG